MSNPMFHAIDSTGPRATGWLLSCLLHGGLAFASMLFMQRLELVPETAPFQWNVTMVAPSSTEPPSTAESSVLPTQSTTDSAPELQQPTPPPPAPHQGPKPSQPRGETPTTPSPPPVTASADQPAPSTPPASPSIAEFPPPLPNVHTASPNPTGRTDQVVIHSEAITSLMQSLAPSSSLARAIPPTQSSDTPAAAPPQEATPAEPADLSPSEEPPSQPPFPTTTERLPPVLTEAAPTSKEAQPSPRRSASSESHATAAATPPQEATPAEPADLSPSEEPPSQPPFPTTTERLPPVLTEAAPPSKEAQPSPRPFASSESHVAAAPAANSKPAKSDYGWLATLMGRWIEDLDKRYPAMLRIEGIQGKVTLMALLHEDGILSDVRVAKSSGNTMLDQVAVEDVRKGSPITLSRPLERRQMPVKFSIIYDLKTAW